MKFRKKNISIETDIEKRIITALIVSDDFCKNIIKSIRLKYFKIDYAKIICKWILDYFEKHRKAPNRHIKDIFIVEKQNLKKEEIELIDYFLEDISDEYEEKGLNVNFLIDKAKDYFDKRSHEILFVDGQKLVSAGRVEEAKKLLDSHKGTIRDTGKVFDPFSPSEINSYDVDEKSNRLFVLPDAMGQMVGPLQRGWLLAITAPEKRGKSWILEEIAFQSILNGCNTLYVSLEMNKDMLKDRLYRRLTGRPKSDVDRILYPIFDCKFNQDDSCEKKERIKSNFEIKEEIESLDNEDIPITILYDKFRKYRTCTYCRDNKIDKRSKFYFHPVYWFAKQGKTKRIDNEIITKKSQMFYSNKRGSRLRVRSFPSFSANSEDIKNEIENLEYSEGFVIDVLILDYFDIQKPEKNSGFSERSIIDTIWKQGKNIADTRQCLVITADQSNKASRLKQSVETSDTTEDKRKDAHLDIRVALNQTNREKEDGILRANILFHRHQKFNTKREVMILQQLDLAQPMMDSEFMVFENKSNRKKRRRS